VIDKVFDKACTVYYMLLQRRHRYTQTDPMNAEFTLWSQGKQCLL